MKGLANYLSEERRRKEERELQEFIDRTRREIAETEEWLRQEEETEEEERCIEPSEMFYLLKRCGGIVAFERFEFHAELKEMAATMGLTVAQTATYILVAGLQCRCPGGVGPADLARYTGEEHAAGAWRGVLSGLCRLGLLSISGRGDKGIVYYKINMQ